MFLAKKKSTAVMRSWRRGSSQSLAPRCGDVLFECLLYPLSMVRSVLTVVTTGNQGIRVPFWEAGVGRGGRGGVSYCIQGRQQAHK